MKNVLGLVLLMVLFSNCAQENIEEIEITPSFDNAVAVLHPINGSEVSGTVYFTKEGNGVRVQAEISGLTGGKHGFHIHQYGDCTAEDGTSAGGHFNPREKEHSGPDAMNRHMGDMGNITANDGAASLDYLDETIVLEEIIGRGVIVHAGEDDLESQPSGAAGPRVSCGVIGIQQ
jgi:Cu-Zn family superoxide dismutase